MDVNDLNVSRETRERFRDFGALVEKWTSKINLISKASVPDLWQRHILDSAQIYTLAPNFNHWVDLGSGGGFPGLIVAIMAKEAHPASNVTLIESDQRKSAFLRTAIRELELPATVITDRIELVSPQGADVVSARALTDMARLIGFANRHLKPSGTALFQKGSNWEKENEEALIKWSYVFEAVKSKTNPDAVVLKIKEISRV